MSNLEPPHSTDAERAVLGACIRFPESLDEVIQILKSGDDFYTPKHRTIYDRMLEYFRDHNAPPDLTSIGNRLVETQEIEQIGGRLYLVELAEDCVTAAYARRHAEIVRDHRERRNAITTLTEAIRSLQDFTEDVNQVMGDVAECLDSGDISEVVDLRRMAPAFAESLLSGRSPYPFKISTAIDDLEALTDGFVPGDYVVVAAPPGHGKTAFALDLAFYRACQGDNGLYFAMDQMSRSMVQRLFSAETGLPKKALMRAFEDHQSCQAVNMATDRLSRLPGAIFSLDRANLGMTEIRAKSRQFKRKHDIRYIVIDYIQQIRAGRRSENRTNEMTEISGQIKALAKEMEVPVIALSQLSRAYDTEGCDPQRDKWPRPRLTMLRDSGAIEADASTVIFLMNKARIVEQRYGTDSDQYRKFTAVHGDRQAAEIFVAKQKEGPTGSVSCLFDKTTMRFACLSRFDRTAQEEYYSASKNNGRGGDYL